MELKDILNHHLSGGNFEYLSVKFKEAAAEYEQTKEWQSEVNLMRSFQVRESEIRIKSTLQIPEEILEKHSYWRIGKLRSVAFNPSGSIYRIKLGAKYSISIYNMEKYLNKVRFVTT